MSSINKIVLIYFNAEMYLAMNKIVLPTFTFNCIITKFTLKKHRLRYNYVEYVHYVWGYSVA